MTLRDLIQQADMAFDKHLAVKKPNQDYLDALRALNLSKHSRLYGDYDRHQMAESVGLPQVTIRETIEMMVDSPIKRVIELTPSLDNQEHFWHRSQHYRTFRPEQISFETVSGQFYQFQVGCPNYLKSKIPYGVLLRMKEVQDLNLFDCFFAIAPLDRWLPGEPANTDPVIVTSLRNPEDHCYRHFFLAQW